MLKKIIILSSCICFPVFASPPILKTDMLDRNEHLSGVQILMGEADFKGNFNTTTKMSGIQKVSFLRLLYGYGISNDQMLTIGIPYAVSSLNKIEFTLPNDTLTTIESSNIGLADITVDYAVILFKSLRQRFKLGVGIRFPVGSDDAGSPEIVENGLKTQSKKNGGAGSGRTDYKLETNYSISFARTVLFASGRYILQGTKTENGVKFEPGDEISFSSGILQKLTAKTDVAISITYEIFRSEKNGDTEISSNSAYGIITEIFYKVTDNFVISPKLKYVNFTESKESNRIDNTTMKILDARLIAASLFFHYSY